MKTTCQLILSLLLALALIGCPAADDDDAADDDTADDDDTTAWEPPDGGVIELAAQDGVILEADYYPSDTQGAPSIILLHMYAVYYDRTDWPLDFIEMLEGHGWAVMVPDRRGAGNSEGDPEESWAGEKGKWDVEACAVRLRDDGYGAPGIIGASNGTTSMIDYAIWAPGEGLPEAVILGYMTGGSYTTANNFMSSVPVVPSIFTYADDETAWSETNIDDDPGTWEFHEYDVGPGMGHGTDLFNTAPEVYDDLDAFLLTWM